MVSIVRKSNEPYAVDYGTALLKDVAVKARPMPAEYFNAEGNFVSGAFLDYIRPLIGELPDFIELERKFV